MAALVIKFLLKYGGPLKSAVFFVIVVALCLYARNQGINSERLKNENTRLTEISDSYKADAQRRSVLASKYEEKLLMFHQSAQKYQERVDELVSQLEEQQKQEIPTSQIQDVIVKEVIKNVEIPSKNSNECLPSSVTGGLRKLW